METTDSSAAHQHIKVLTVQNKMGIHARPAAMIVRITNKLKADVLVERDEDIRSLKALIIFGLKGMAAYTEHAEVLGFSDPKIHTFIQKALAATLSTRLSAEDLVALTLETGEYGVAAMSLLDRANTTTYGHPQITKVNIVVRKNPGILISGHDLKDL